MLSVFVYAFSLLLVAGGIWYAYQRQRFSFHLLFSLIYAVTFFAGFPLSLIMAAEFAYVLPSESSQVAVFTMAGGGYLLYALIYWWGIHRLQAPLQAVQFADFSTKLTACLLAIIGLGTLFTFIGLNDGFLLFRLEKYSQIFSAQVSGVALKRFFYFFLVALVAWFLWKSSRKRWVGLLIVGCIFGGLSYVAVGGTRANLALAVAFFVLLGIYQGYLSAKWLLFLALLGGVAMFFLALARYGLDVKGREAWFTFLYLTRDSFSPWENVARIVSEPIEYQGLMPIVRDFYVYIPQSLWQDRPDIVWNTANYFTKTVLGNQSGLAMSPTLFGSFYIMGGYPFVAIGMAAVGGLLAMFDRVFFYAKAQSVLLQAFCFGQLFNMMVLIREGVDAFFSRFAFFSVVFVVCWAVACFVQKGVKGNG